MTTPRRFRPVPPRPRSKSPALDYLYDRYIGDDPERIASYERARADCEIGQAIYDLRTAAGLTHNELARRVGTTAGVILRLEEADYAGHSFSMLRRIAAATCGGMPIFRGSVAHPGLGAAERDRHVP